MAKGSIFNKVFGLSLGDASNEPLLYGVEYEDDSEEFSVFVLYCS